MNKKNFKRIISSNLGLTLFLIALIIRFSFSIFPDLYEVLYFKGAFPIIRYLQSKLSFIWILPGYYLLFLGLLTWMIWRFPQIKNFKMFFKKISNFCGGVGASFLFLWGFNYADKGFANRIDLPHSDQKINLSSFYLATIDTAMKYRNSINESFQTIVEVKNIPTDEEINNWVRNTLIEYHYPTATSVKVNYLKPSGVLLKLSIAGIYNPFTGEANVDNALASLPRIFTAAHEIAHAYGVTSEAEANFVAYLACIQSNNALAQYAASYSLWRQIAFEINQTFTEEERHFLSNQIPTALQNDRKAIIEAQSKHKSNFPLISEAVNHTYLKIQGVEKGAQDYHGFLQLYLRWELSRN